MNEIAKVFATLGIIFLFLGGLIFLWGKLPFSGKLPGDILIKRENFTFYFPMATCIVLSIILSFLFMLFNRR